MTKKICMLMAALLAFAMVQVNGVKTYADEITSPLLCFIDSPYNEQTIKDSVTVAGWAVYSLDGNTSALGNIDISIDSITERASRYERPDVKAVITGYGDYSKSGFEATLDTSSLENGDYLIEISIWDAANENVLQKAYRVITKSSEVKLPFLSLIDYPRVNEAYIDTLYISGWALNTKDGITNDIGKVEVQVGTLQAKNATLLKRNDLVTAVRGYGDYKNSGFASLVDISSLDNGDTPVIIRIYDTSNKLLYTHSLMVSKQNDAPKPFIAMIDSPALNEAVTNNLLVKGWALYTETGTTNNIGSVEVIVGDEEPIAPAFSLREDVKNAVPGYGDYSNCGFSATVDISAFDNGTYPVVINFYDDKDEFIGTVSTSFGKSSSAPKAFLASIDTPARLEDVAGEVNVSGWALYTPDGDSNAIGKVEVIANGETTVADMSVRDDLKSVIGGYGDYENSGFSADIDLAGLKGEQDIIVKVYDDNDVLLGQMVRTVITHSKPEISNISITSSNEDPTKAVDGDIVTLTFTTDEPVTKLSNFKICGSNPETFTNDGLNYTVTHIVDDGDARGEATFQINVKNEFGLYSVTTEETTDESFVMIVDEAPIISDVRISSNNTDPRRAISGDVITLSFKSSQPVVKASTFKLCGGNDGDLVLEDGVYKISHKVTDKDYRGFATFQLDVENAKGMKTSVKATSDNSFVVVDTAAPVISNICIESNNPVDPTRAIIGDTITLTFTTNEPITKLENFKICGSNPETFTNDGLNYTVTHIVDDGDTIGKATFQINVKNSAGLYSITTEETTDDSSVMICGKPEILSVSISSSNADPTKAVNGDIITLTFTASEPVSKLSNFKICGSNPDTFTTTDGYTYTATHMVDGGDKRSNEDGFVMFQINVKNDLGLYSLTVEETTDGSYIEVVDEAPQILTVSIRSTNANPAVAVNGDYIILTFTTNEPVTKLSNFKINGSNPNNFSNVGNTYTAIHLVDNGDPRGVSSFQINVENAVGLYSITTEETTDGSSVTIE